MTTFNAQALKTIDGQQAWERTKAELWTSLGFKGQINFGAHTVVQVLDHNHNLSLTPERAQEAMLFYMNQQRELLVAKIDHTWFIKQSALLSSDSNLFQITASTGDN